MVTRYYVDIENHLCMHDTKAEMKLSKGIKEIIVSAIGVEEGGRDGLGFSQHILYTCVKVFL